MGEQIIDGKGAGYRAEVDSKQRLRTYSVNEVEAAWINRVEDEMYSGFWSSSGMQAATGGNWIVYLKNTHDTKDLIITKLKHRVEDDSGSISIWLNVLGTPSGGTDLTPGNRNAGSNNVANCTYQYGTNITGLSGGRKVGSSYGITTAPTFHFQEPCSGWILPPNATLGVKADNNTATHFGGFGFFFRDAE